MLRWFQALTRREEARAASRQPAMALGTLARGWRIEHTMSSKFTRLSPEQGFCAEAGGAIVVGGADARRVG